VDFRAVDRARVRLRCRHLEDDAVRGATALGRAAGALIFRTLDALRVFDVFYVFFGNRPDTQTMAIYAQSTIVGDGHVGYGSAISVAIFLIIAVFVIIYVTATRVSGDE
jgi:ABC-type sugar transport system permease subunit